jgi:hypothetical protein
MKMKKGCSKKSRTAKRFDYAKFERTKKRVFGIKDARKEDMGKA